MTAVFSTTVPLISLQLHGTFTAGSRRRVVYRLMVDGQQIGTAVATTAQAMSPWSLTIARTAVMDKGFPNRLAMIHAVERYLATGRI
jgi:hypothetical protein